MAPKILIAGGGIGGLAAALACGRADCDVRLFERATEISEVGAGIQLGPNAVRVLHGLGLATPLARVAAFPPRLQVRDAVSGRELGKLALAERAVRKYGAPYVTVHRADLQALLLAAVQSCSRTVLQLGTMLTGYTDTGRAIHLQTSDGHEVHGDALIGADGLWSRVRELMVGGHPPRVTGHLAYRALLPQNRLPERLRSQQITVWLGPKLHAVQYPVRGGDLLNVVVIVQGQLAGDLQSWDHDANAAELRSALIHAAPPLRDVIDAVSENTGTLRLWGLCDRPPIAGAQQQAQGRVALLGDAAHPMRPYLAQGAGMAIEDALELGRALANDAVDMPARLHFYAKARWRRCARVQSQAVRNGIIFHAQGALRWSRDASLRLLGERLLDAPWLYAGGPVPGPKSLL